MITTEREASPKSAAAGRPQLGRLLVVRLARLRRIMQRSASSAFGRETGLNDFDWLVILFVGAHGSPVITEIGGCLRRDKGQVSRSVARLTASGLITRDHLRAPLVLTRSGRETYKRILRLLKARNSALLEGVSVDERRLLNGVIDKLFRGADALLAHERPLAEGEPGGAEGVDGAEGDADTDNWRSSRSVDPSSPDWLVMPDLHQLLRLLRKSAGLAHGRVTGLSHFDWRTITHIEVNGPLTLSRLIVTLDRNKSQVGRAVARLVELGLVQRRREDGVASIVLSTTPAGRAAYDLIVEESKRRDAVLVEQLTPGEHQALDSILDRLVENAGGLLARERERVAAEAEAPKAAASGQ